MTLDSYRRPTVTTPCTLEPIGAQEGTSQTIKESNLQERHSGR
jgi:hypothetical protein